MNRLARSSVAGDRSVPSPSRALLRVARSAWLGFLGLACQPVLDVGTWLGASAPVSDATNPSPPMTVEVPTVPFAPGSAAGAAGGAAGAGPEQRPGSGGEAGSSPVDSGVGPFDAGRDTSTEPDAAGGEAGLGDGDASFAGSDAGTACTFPPAQDEGALIAAREWSEPIEVPWSTGFEEGFCAFSIPSGYCLASVDASYEVSEAPVRSGGAAAAFSVASQDSLDGVQSRCVRRGVLPEEAYYGAWYFFPELVETPGNWNLFHFLGGDGEARHALWDLSLHNGEDGQLYLHVFDQMTGAIHNPAGAPPMPIGQWVHIQVYLRRAADTTGELALYQDGERLLRLIDTVTDDTERGAWYVGNWADDLRPPELTVYVDDVTIRQEL